MPTPNSLPDPGDTTLNIPQTQPSPDPDFNSPQRSNPDKSYANLAGPQNDFAVPTMSELGLKLATTPHRGGETRALAALDRIIANKDYTATFSKPETAPTAFSPQSTTLLSPHHHFGSLSVRELYWRAQDVIAAYPKGKASTIPTNLLGQLLFRDMYFAAQASLGYVFAQTHGNSRIRFVPWHLPSTVSPSTGLVTGTYTIDSPEPEIWFQRWKYGRTGFPWIDALMRQLRQEGWIHHLGRHAVACFLTRGGCYVDWERGAEVFEEWLIDHETACNAGNWQWLGCVAFYAQFYRCYSPIAFPKKWDKHGAFVRRYVPELKAYPDKYIYEPWKAPIADQKKAGCLVVKYNPADDISNTKPPDAEDKTYPKPLFDFDLRRAICIEGIKSAYKIGLYGDDARVRDGTWRALFPDEAEGPTEGAGEGGASDGTQGIGESKGKETVRKDVNVEKEDTGVDQDEREAAAVGGEDQKVSEASRSRPKRKRQGTLDVALATRSKRGRGGG